MRITAVPPPLLPPPPPLLPSILLPPPLPPPPPLLPPPSSLRTLHLSANQLVVLPRSIVKLKFLSALVISFNEFEYLPKVLKDLSLLKVLSMAGNAVRYVLPSGGRSCKGGECSICRVGKLLTYVCTVYYNIAYICTDNCRTHFVRISHVFLLLMFVAIYTHEWTYIVGVVRKRLVWYCGFRECQ